MQAEPTGRSANSVITGARSAPSGVRPETVLGTRVGGVAAWQVGVCSVGTAAVECKWRKQEEAALPCGLVNAVFSTCAGMGKGEGCMQ